MTVREKITYRDARPLPFIVKTCEEGFQTFYGVPRGCLAVIGIKEWKK